MKNEEAEGETDKPMQDRPVEPEPPQSNGCPKALSGADLSTPVSWLGPFVAS